MWHVKEKYMLLEKSLLNPMLFNISPGMLDTNVATEK